MKANRKIIKNNEAVSTYLAVMIFTAITVALVAIVWIFQGAITDEAPKKLTPYIGMIQQDDHIIITGVRNGPIPTTSVLIELINLSTGMSEGEAYINDNGDGDINSADSIILTGITKGAYSITILYNELVIGSCQYTIYKN